MRKFQRHDTAGGQPFYQYLSHIPWWCDSKETPSDRSAHQQLHQNMKNGWKLWSNDIYVTTIQELWWVISRKVVFLTWIAPIRSSWHGYWRSLELGEEQHLAPSISRLLLFPAKWGLCLEWRTPPGRSWRYVRCQVHSKDHDSRRQRHVGHPFLSELLQQRRAFLLCQSCRPQ